jgi:hypothetical protein
MGSRRLTAVSLMSTMFSKSMVELIRSIDANEDAVRAGLLLKYQFPHDDIKVREIISTEEAVMRGNVLH